MDELYLLVFILIIPCAFLTFYLLKKRKINNFSANNNKNDQDNIIKEEVTLQKEELLIIDSPLSIQQADPSNLKTGKIIESNDKLW
jgi:hypothetical protein